MASVPTPLVARFIRKYSPIHGASAGHSQKSGSACSAGLEAELRPYGRDGRLEPLADIVQPIGF